MPDAPPVFDPGPVALPSDRAWLDPALVGRNLYVKTTDTPVDPNVPTLVAIPNPYRWAVGFVLTPRAGTGARYAPFADLQFSGGFPLPDAALDWYDLKTYGPLVMGGWFAVGGADAICRTIEVIRRTGG